MSNFANVLSKQFDTQLPNIDLTVLRDIKSLHQDSQHVALVDCNLPLSAYLLARNVAVDVSGSKSGADLLQHKLYSWDSNSKGIYSKLVTGTFNFKYDTTQFLVYKVTWANFGQISVLYDFVFDAQSDEPGQKLVEDVYNWSNGLKDEIWVFQQGHWTKDKALWKAVQSTSGDDLVLNDAFLDGLRRDTKTFFSSEDIYQSLGITWKRGLLLLGPPGNGKTESIKVLLKESGQAALYVKSFTTQVGPEFGVRVIFEHARSHAPCILVIEDLDSMVTDDVRSFFLNELDGLGQNEGILTIATTNHPEKIDDAILNRPSRFDVKYNFDLPVTELRAKYIAKWLKKIKKMGALTNAEVGDTRIWVKDEDEIAKEIAGKTEGWSFAFLKELFVSFLLRLAHDRSRAEGDTDNAAKDATTFDDVLLRQVDQLAGQILKVETVKNDETPGYMVPQRSQMTYARAMGVRGMVAETVHAGANF